jgi:putative Holliday junction resolvase
MSRHAETVLALDFGERYIGVAVGDASIRVAHPLATIDARDAKSRFDAIGEFIGEWHPARLVVGLPLDLEGDPHAVSRRAQRFARQLEGRFGLPVTLVDERLSSSEAAARLRDQGRAGRKHKQLEHPVAAQVILEDYFANAIA